MPALSPTQHVAAVIPCYNVGGRVRPVVEGALAHLARVIIVDDGSTDHSVESLKGLPVEVVTLPHNRGKGHALLAGFGRALEQPLCSGVCVLDADGQHNPAEIPKFLAAFATEEADLVMGSRVFEGDQVPWRSRFGNRMTVRLTAWLLGQRIADTQCGFRLLSRRYAEEVVQEVAGGRYETEMEILVRALRRGYKVTSVPIATIYEPGNPSSHFHKLRDSYLVYRRLWRAARHS